MVEEREILFAYCFSCAQPFTFDPETVASVVIDLATGKPVPAGRRVRADEPRPESWVSQAVCEPCADKVEAVALTLGVFPLWPVRQAQKVSQ